MFKGCINLKSLKGLNLENCTGMETAFINTPLSKINNITFIQSDSDISTITDVNEKILIAKINSNTTNINCTNKNLVFLSLNGRTDISDLFMNNQSIEYINIVDGSNNVTNMNQLFRSCNNLITVEGLNTSNALYLYSLFRDCSSLVNIPELNTSTVINMSNMFQNCSSLVNIPDIDCSNTTCTDSMFAGCHSLESVPNLDLSKVTSMRYMFNECTSLKTIGQLKIAVTTDMIGFFNGCTSLESVTFDPTITNWTGYDLDLSACKLNYQALLNLFNSLPKLTTRRTLTITGNPGTSSLTSTNKTIATNKNWTLIC